MQHEITKTPNFKGYSAVLSSNNDPNGSGDMHEGFEFGYEPLGQPTSDTINGNNGTNNGVMAGANVWPKDEDARGFREAVLGY